MSDPSPEYILFRATGRPPKVGEFYPGDVGTLWKRGEPDDARYVDFSGFTRHAFDLDAAVERVMAMYPYCDASEVRAAILPPSPVEPAPWEIEAAREWGKSTVNVGFGEEFAQALARHFAAARARAWK